VILKGDVEDAASLDWDLTEGAASGCDRDRKAETLP